MQNLASFTGNMMLHILDDCILDLRPGQGKAGHSSITWSRKWSMIWSVDEASSINTLIREDWRWRHMKTKLQSSDNDGNFCFIKVLMSIEKPWSLS